MYRQATLQEREVRDAKLPFSQVVTGTSGGSVAVNPRHQVTLLDVVGSSDNTFTLGDALEGQVMTVRAQSVGGTGNGVLTPSNLGNGTSITFTAAGETAEMMFADGVWNVTGIQGAAVS